MGLVLAIALSIGLTLLKWVVLKMLPFDNKSEFQVVLDMPEGTSTPWGLDYAQHGEFFVTACVIPHLYHIVPGGRYQRQAGQHLNANTYEDIKTIADLKGKNVSVGAVGSGRSSQRSQKICDRLTLSSASTLWASQYS